MTPKEKVLGLLVWAIVGITGITFDASLHFDVKLSDTPFLLIIGAGLGPVAWIYTAVDLGTNGIPDPVLIHHRGNLR